MRQTGRLLLLTVLALFSCSRSENYKTATVTSVHGKPAIKLKGRRKLMVHDPVSALFGKTYEDSLLLAVPHLTDGIIRGAEIPAKPGYYSYEGGIIIRGNFLSINLLAGNRKLTPLDWNGDYTLVR